MIGHYRVSIISRCPYYILCIGEAHIPYEEGLAKSDPGSYMCLVFGAADQTKFYLHHFPTHTKDELGHGQTVHLVYVWNHAAGSQLELFAMT